MRVDVGLHESGYLIYRSSRSDDSCVCFYIVFASGVRALFPLGVRRLVGAHLIPCLI